MELDEGGEKGLKEVTPFPRGIEFELTTVGGVIELGTPVPRVMEGDVTPIGRRIVLECITVGRGLGLTLVPR